MGRALGLLSCMVVHVAVGLLFPGLDAELLYL